ncbi:hypothetical protein Rumeso_00299 [Rubellimicrobium mesophilum DSM 19309]|uniref:Uncharacterized protein n=1 Tax=Rubellimicrobium mesophilum DSM 19309 TaxID=442562 RepID=A0A017HUQ2_9RHOB|nr:hypothetical protein Rumeso_00299 [Rubellimicrobium mesophilum DSM 19309]
MKKALTAGENRGRPLPGCGPGPAWNALRAAMTSAWWSESAEERGPGGRHRGALASCPMLDIRHSPTDRSGRSHRAGSPVLPVEPNFLPGG